MNYRNRQRVLSHLVSQVPSTHAVLVFRRASFVSCLACSEKGWHGCNRFRPDVGAYLLSRCCVPRAGRLLQHGGIRQGIACRDPTTTTPATTVSRPTREIPPLQEPNQWILIHTSDILQTKEHYILR